MSYVQALAATCNECEVSTEAGCVPCQPGSTLPSCQGCNQVPWYERPVMGPVIIGVISTATTAIAMAWLQRRTKLPVG